jgi:hypothetical protein
MSIGSDWWWRSSHKDHGYVPGHIELYFGQDWNRRGPFAEFENIVVLTVRDLLFSQYLHPHRSSERDFWFIKHSCSYSRTSN